MSAYSSEVREKITGALRAAGLDADRAAIATDLACHAAERASLAFRDVVVKAPDGVVGLALTQIGTQLARAQFQRLFEFTEQQAQQLGCTTGKVEVSI